MIVLVYFILIIKYDSENIVMPLTQFYQKHSFFSFDSPFLIIIFFLLQLICRFVLLYVDFVFVLYFLFFVCMYTTGTGLPVSVASVAGFVWTVMEHLVLAGWFQP